MKLVFVKVINIPMADSFADTDNYNNKSTYRSSRVVLSTDVSLSGSDLCCYFNSDKLFFDQISPVLAATIT